MFYHMEPQKITQAHDRFFSESMQKIGIAYGILNLFLDLLILQKIDLYTLEILKNDWVNEKLKKSQADIVYSANISSSKNSICFLFEHKSYLESDTYRQLFRYMNSIWEQIENEKNGIKHSKKLPPIIPIIIYHGNNPWNIVNSIKPSFAITKEMHKYIPDFEAVVVDLSVTDISSSLEPVELRAFLLALKYSRSEYVFDAVSKIIRMFNSQSDQEYLKTILIYIGAVIKAEKKEMFLSIINEEHKEGEAFMKTIADVLREEGRKIERERSKKIESDLRLEKEKLQKTESNLRIEKGKLQKTESNLRIEREKSQKTESELRKEIIIIIQNLLQRNMNIETIHEITHIPVDKILKIKRELKI